MRGELYSYDPRGNILKVSDITSAGSAYQQYSYSGDCLTAVSNIESGVIDETFSFCHDNLGRMTHDGLSGLQMAYNHMDLPTKVRRDSTILVNYSYLADGRKASSLKASGEGLVYRGPFTYRRSAVGILSLESVVCAEGRLTPDKALLYVTDHLGSVRAVIDGNTGSAREASDYSVYGSRSYVLLSRMLAPVGPGFEIGDLAPIFPGGNLGSGGIIAPSITYRDHFTGQEDQMPDFGIPYSDHGARQYNPALRRWMTPDPLSEKYYGLSPYNYCGDDPVNHTDKNGKFFETAWDIANVLMDASSLVANIAAGNVGGAIVDAVSLVADAASVAVPGLPGGVGTAVKAARTADKAVDAVRTVDKVKDVANIASDTKTAQKTYQTYTKTNPLTGEVYVGRTSGTGTPKQNILRRDKNHHMNKKGFGPAVLDKSSSNPNAIRGQEQYMIDLNGGAKVHGGNSGNTINGVSPNNPKKDFYEQERIKEFK